MYINEQQFSLRPHFDWSTMMIRYLCATVLLWTATHVNVGAFTLSSQLTKVSNEPALKSPLFRRAPAIEVPHENRNPVSSIQKQVKHFAVVAAAAVVWRGAVVSEAHAAVRIGMKTKEPPATVMTKVRDLVANDKTTAGTVFVATGAGVILGRTSVKKDEKDTEDDFLENESTGSTVVGIEKEIQKLEKKKQDAMKILERIQQEQAEGKTSKADKKRMLTAAEIETQKIFERIRIEREEKLNAIKQPGYDPLNLDRFPDTTPKKSQAETEMYVDKLTTRDRVNLLIEKYMLEEEMVNPETKAYVDKTTESNESKTPHPPTDALPKRDTSDVKLKRSSPGTSQAAAVDKQQVVAVKQTPPTESSVAAKDNGTSKDNETNDKSKLPAESATAELKAQVAIGNSKGTTDSKSTTPSKNEKPASSGKQTAAIETTVKSTSTASSKISSDAVSLESSALPKEAVATDKKSLKAKAEPLVAPTPSVGSKAIFNKRKKASKSHVVKPETSDNVKSPDLKLSDGTNTLKEVISQKQDKTSDEKHVAKSTEEKSANPPIVMSTTPSDDSSEVHTEAVLKNEAKGTIVSVEEAPVSINAKSVTEAKAHSVKSETQESPKVNGKAETTNVKVPTENDKTEVVEEIAGKINNENQVADSKSPVLNGKPAAPLEEVKPATGAGPSASPKSRQPTSTQLNSMANAVDTIAPLSAGLQLDETKVAEVKKGWRPLVARKYASIYSLEDRAFAVLQDLGMIELHPDPEAKDYDSTMDDDFVE